MLCTLFSIAYKLQDLAYQTEELIAFRNSLVEDMQRKVQELNRDNFAVRQHIKYVDKFCVQPFYAQNECEEEELDEDEVVFHDTLDDDLNDDADEK